MLVPLPPTLPNPGSAPVIVTTGGIALRAMPIYLKNGNKKLKANALLGDASTMIC